MQHVYFNHWFSSAYRFLELIKNDYRLYVTNNLSYSPMQNLTEMFNVEPTLNGVDLISYYASYCEENDIDFFVPRKNIVLISEHRAKFDAKLLLCASDSNMKVLDDKIKTYEICKDIATIPKYKIVNDKQSFIEAYKEISQFGTVCVKPAIGEGGIGFKKIKERDLSLDYLNSYNDFITYEELLHIFGQQESFQDFMVMEYLEGYECSIDCLGYNGQLLTAIPRRKENSRIRVLEENFQLCELAREITKKFNLSYAYNIQVKMKGNEYKLLEINPRMAGGTHTSCLSGVNIPLLALKILDDPNYYDLHKSAFIPKLGVTSYGLSEDLRIF